MLTLKNIKKIYNEGTISEKKIFEGFNLQIEDGEFVSIIGSNGSGKSTLLNVICGSIPLEGGDILLNNKSIFSLSEYKRSNFIGRVYQNPASGTCPSMNVLENMALADNKGKSFNLGLGVNKKRIPYYKELLKELGLGLENNLSSKVGLLSGGQRQAIALLMSTMANINCLILDEHTAALDPSTSDTIIKLTDKIIKERKLTSVMVTHNLRHAIEYGSRLIMMHQGEIILDIKNSEKEKADTDYLLKLFYEISVESGNAV